MWQSLHIQSTFISMIIFFSSVAQSRPTLCDPMTAAHQASLSITNWSLLKLMSIESVMPSNHLIFCHPLLLPPSIFPSIKVFSNESVLCIRWVKYWSFSFSISPSNEYSGLISFKMDWLDLLAVQGNLKSLPQHHSSKALIQHSTFHIVHLSHPCMTTGKTITLTDWHLLVMPLLFNMLSSTGVLFQQPGNQLKGVSGVGGQCCSLWLEVQDYMFISSSGFLLYFDKSIRSEVWHF